jgi:MFS family permease
MLFLIAACGFNMLWNFVLPFILAAVGEFQTNGTMVGNAIAVQMLGLGIGPFVASWLTDGSSYLLVELVCIGCFLISFVLLMTTLRAHNALLHEGEKA